MSQCGCIYFDTGTPETCIQRVQSRTGHPTLNPETIGKDSGLIEKVVNNFAQQIEPPTQKEGFGFIKTVKNFSEIGNVIEHIMVYPPHPNMVYPPQTTFN